MKKELLNTRFVKCKCVFSKKLNKLIPITKLKITENSFSEFKEIKDEEFESNNFLGEYFYEETNETFNQSSEVLDGLFDLITEQVLPFKKLYISSSWINNSLIGKKAAIKIKYERTPFKFELKKVIKLKTDYNYERTHTFIKYKDLNYWLSTNNKIIINNQKEDLNFDEDELIELSEIYVYCVFEDKSSEIAEYLTFLNED